MARSYELSQIDTPSGKASLKDLTAKLVAHDYDAAASRKRTGESAPSHPSPNHASDPFPTQQPHGMGPAISSNETRSNGDPIDSATVPDLEVDGESTKTMQQHRHVASERETQAVANKNERIQKPADLALMYMLEADQRRLKTTSVADDLFASVWLPRGS